jgi:hypothetical protein
MRHRRKRELDRILQIERDSSRYIWSLHGCRETSLYRHMYDIRFIVHRMSWRMYAQTWDPTWRNVNR